MTRSPPRRPARGFTLTELLIVVGIIAGLAAILLPTLALARRKARNAGLAAQLQTIASAIDAYKADFGDVPRIGAKDPNSSQNAGTPGFSGPWHTPQPAGFAAQEPGARLLAWALLGPYELVSEDTAAIPRDGSNGSGIRVRDRTGNLVMEPPAGQAARGKVFGPYLDPNKSNVTGDAAQGAVKIADGYGKPVLYYPAPVIVPTIQVGGNTVTPVVGSRVAATGTVRWPADYAAVGQGTALLARTDNSLHLERSALNVLVGDVEDASSSTAPPDGLIGPTERRRFSGPYLLVGAGADGKFTDVADGLTAAQRRQILAKTDDVTNLSPP